MLFEINQSISQSVTTQSVNQPINVNTWDIRTWRCPGIWRDSVFVTHSCGLLKYRISSNNSRGDYFYFRTKKRGNYSKAGNYYQMEAIISNIPHRRTCPKYFVLLYLAIKEKGKYLNITVEKTVKKPGAFVTIQL